MDFEAEEIGNLQPGTFNERANSATFNNEVKSTELSAASVGVKSRFWDQKLQVNDEFFYYDYRNLLLQSYNVAAAFEPIFNAKSVTIYGDQLDVTVKPTTDDQVIATGAFTHGVYNNFTTPDGLSYNNNSLAFTPTWTFDAGYAHDFHINFGSIKARFDARYASSYWGDFAHTPGDKWTSFWTFDSSVTYRPNDQVWSIGLWGKNLTNVPVQTATGIGAAAHLWRPHHGGFLSMTRHRQVSGSGDL